MRTTTQEIREAPDHLDRDTMEGLMANIKEVVQSLLYHQFQQIAALYSPRPGMPDSDAIPFTRTTAEELHQALLAYGLKSIVIAYTGDGKTSYSVILAKADRGIAKAEQGARKIARKNRARLEIFK